MLTHPTIEKLHALHRLKTTSRFSPRGVLDRFGLLVDTEWTAREQRRLTQRLRSAKLRYAASLEDVGSVAER